MLRKMITALLAAASMAMFAPDAASARGGGMGGHFGGGMGGHFAGGMGGGMHMGGGPHFGGGFHGGGFHGFHHRFGGIGLGFYGPYYDGDYYSYDGYPSYVDQGDSDCYLVRRRVYTRHGWRLRRVQVCE
jgi:hypothetical protein